MKSIFTLFVFTTQVLHSVYGGNPIDLSIIFYFILNIFFIPLMFFVIIVSRIECCIVRDIEKCIKIYINFKPNRFLARSKPPAM